MSADPTLFERLIAAPLTEAAGREWQADDDATAAEDRRIEWAARVVASAFVLACIGDAACLAM